MELEEYKKAIRDLMESGSSEIISNGQLLHAAALYELFSKEAKYQIDIFCKNLSAEVFGLTWVKEAFKAALERGVSIRLLIQEKLSVQNEILNEIQNPKLQVKYADKNISQFKFNFSVMDNRAYRYESDKQDCKAIAQLNDSKNCKKLNDTFAVLWNNQEALA